MNRTLRQTLESLTENDILLPSDRKGIYLGRTSGDREAWIDRDDMTKHVFVNGATGSGKTELLLSMCSSAIAAGSGTLFVDGKGDIATFAKVYAIARLFGREEDVLLLNFSHAVPPGQEHGGFLSNTIDPFARMSAQAISQLLVGLMDDPGTDNALWKSRAIAMTTGVVSALCWLRDAKDWRTDVHTYRKYVHLHRIIDLAYGHDDMPATIVAALRSYLSSLPGYKEEKGHAQAQTTLDQHGYLEMQLTRIFTSLADEFGHIFKGPGGGDIDLSDAVLNRRIVVVLLPSLEKTMDEVANLGRIVVALLRNMMARALVTPVEGSWSEIVERRPTNCDYPYLVVFDEVSHYLTPGMAVMAAQARSLGFCLVFATQDADSMMTVSRRETMSILANTQTKILMRGKSLGMSSALTECLPARFSYNTIAGHERSVMEAEIKVLHADPAYIARNGHEGGQDDFHDVLERISTLRKRILESTASDPHVDIGRVVEELGAGEFLAIQHGRFLFGTSMNPSAALHAPSIRVSRACEWRMPEDEIVRAHDNDEAIRILNADLERRLGTWDAQTKAVFERQVTVPKNRARRAFATIAHLEKVSTNVPSNEMVSL